MVPARTAIEQVRPVRDQEGRITIALFHRGYHPEESKHIRELNYATCHTLITTALGAGGKVIGALPERCLTGVGPQRLSTSKVVGLSRKNQRAVQIA
jgi:hypothetical protein